MKATYVLDIKDDRPEELYTLKAAELFELAVFCLRREATGDGPVASSVGSCVGTKYGSLTLIPTPKFEAS